MLTIQMKQKKIMLSSFVVVLFLGLWINYCTNCFGIINEEWFLNWQLDSEKLIWTRVNDLKEYGPFYKAGLLGDYTSQLGLSGTFYGLINLVLPSVYNNDVLHAINVFLLCLVLFYILKWTYDEFGIGTAIIVYLLLFVNSWIIVSARNLYWVTYTFLLPFVVSLYFCQREECEKKCKLKWWLVFGGLSIFIKSACGFEMISLVMINLELPLFYYAIKNSWEKKIFIRRFLLLAAAAILGFAVCMVLHIVQLKIYCQGSLGQAIRTVLENISYRTGAFSTIFTFENEVIRESLTVPKLRILDIYINQVYENKYLLGNLRMNAILIITLILFLFSFISKNICHRIYAVQKKLLSLDTMICVSLLGPLSWLLLATGHCFIHIHINYIMWSMPTIILISVLFGKILVELAKEMLGYPKRYIILTFLAIVSIVLYLYYDGTKPGRIYTESVKTEGKLLSKNSYASIYLLNDRMYILSNRESSDVNFFFHIYIDDVEFINRDFSFEKYEKKMPFWSQTRIAEINLEKEDLGNGNIEIGQFKGEDRLWEEEIILLAPNEVEVLPLTDANWTNGYQNSGNYFLVKTPSSFNTLLVGQKIALPDGTSTVIDEVKNEGDYQWIHTVDNIEKFCLSKINIEKD